MLIDQSIPTAHIMGAIVGDVIGSAYESRYNRTKNPNFMLFPLTTRFTDDSVLTLAVSEWLMGERKPETLVDLLKKYALKYCTAGFGGNFLKWVRSAETQPYASKGNGAAMRVSPIGWVCNSLEETLRLAKLSASVTHNTPEAEEAAMAVAAAIFLARTGQTKTQIKEFLEERFGYDLNRTMADIRQNYEFTAIASQSVPEAIICWLQSDTYEEAVRNAVSLGGDADTQACITGAIAAATPGMEVNQEFADTAFRVLAPDLRFKFQLFHAWLATR